VRAFWANFPTTRNIGLICLTAYTLLVACATALSPYLLFRHHPLAAVVPVMLLFSPPLLLSLRKTARTAAIKDIAPLFILYLVYLLARSVAMLDATLP
jgi:hypothetical protein